MLNLRYDEFAKAYIMVSRVKLPTESGIAHLVGCDCGIRRIVFLSSANADLSYRR